MKKELSDLQMFNLRAKGYMGGPTIGDMLEYLQKKNKKAELMQITLIDPTICEHLHQLVKETLSLRRN